MADDRLAEDAETPVVLPSDTSSSSSGALRFFLLALPWALGLFLVGQDFNTFPAWAVFLSVVVFSVPVALFSLYLVTVRRIHGLAGFASQGWLYSLLGRRLLSNLLWTGFSIVTTFFVLLQFRYYTFVEWLALLAVIPIFYGVFRLIHLVTRREFKPYCQIASALSAARLITPFVALGVYFALLQASDGMREVASLGEAIELRKGDLSVASGSAVVHELGYWMAYFEGARLFLAVQIGKVGTAIASLILALGAWVLFFNAASMLSCFVVPSSEYRRVFTPLSDADAPPQIGFTRGLIVSAISTLLLLSVLLPSFIALELRMQQQPTFAEARSRLDVAVVLIDGHPYRPEVIQALTDLKLDVTRQLDDIHPRLVASLDAGFDRLEANVDPFLDWYYQLSAEYLRALNLLRGDLEAYVGDKLKEHLQQGDPFGEYETLLAEAIAKHEVLTARFSAESAVLLDRYRLTLPEGTPLNVTQSLAINNLLTLPSLDETIPLGTRVGAGGAGGVVTTVIVSKVMAKLYAKSVVKLAVQPLAKVIFSRAAIVGGGMAGGATIGSVVPGPGTAIGAVIGAGVGLVAGVLVDFGLLKLEEHLGRDSFREQLLEAIREAQEELVASWTIRPDS